MTGFEEVAETYADEFASSEELVELARRRLGERIRRSSDRDCPVCGGPIPGWKRADSEFCSAACKARRKRGTG